MKKLTENEWNFFNGYCESAKRQALKKASVYVAGLNLLNLQTQSRLGRVINEMDLIFEERKVLNRPLYILYASDFAALYELFVKLNILNNPEELEKLKQAISLVEKNNKLQLSIIETFAMEEVENFKARQLALKAVGNMNGLDKKNYEEICLQKEEDPKDETIQSSMMDKGKPVKELKSFGCKVSEDHLNALLPVMNEAFHFISPRTSPETVIRIMTCKNLTEIKDELIYLGLRTNEFKCVLDNSHNLFSHISYADIGRSGLFVSTKGKVITETNLNSANYAKNLNTKIIEKILL